MQAVSKPNHTVGQQYMNASRWPVRTQFIGWWMATWAHATRLGLAQGRLVGEDERHSGGVEINELDATRRKCRILQSMDVSEGKSSVLITTKEMSEEARSTLEH